MLYVRNYYQVPFHRSDPNHHHRHHHLQDSEQLLWRWKQWQTSLTSTRTASSITENSLLRLDGQIRLLNRSELYSTWFCFSIRIMDSKIAPFSERKVRRARNGSKDQGRGRSTGKEVQLLEAVQRRQSRKRQIQGRCSTLFDLEVRETHDML